jgi:hypothetical protein
MVIKLLEDRDESVAIDLGHGPQRQALVEYLLIKFE